ncbi:uncharacterized protein LOC117654732 isoform X1 [Pantherophis guttatus]|uniref:Uncharacterized protein LOC117654732 isoform X1 n=2 Tax=Pantherophis guttatus TaxID=94885 RepID=A0A6P9AJ92_PANGU|nr:uncharacterized protein LOC117654732 isoform X1 [Pantherophis guttatus]
MAEKCGDGIHSVECLEKNFMALQKKMEEDFSQVETIQTKVKALSADWEERHQQLKIEQEKVAELEAQIKQLNTKQEEVMASLQADMLRAASQIQEKEGLAERLRSEVAFLEKRVRVACQEAAGSAAELEKGAHEARLALEATLSTLCPQLDREEVVSETLQPEQEAPPPPPREQFLCGQDTECPGKAEGVEAKAEEALQGQPQEAVGGLQEEAEPRASGGVGVTSSTDLLALERHALGPWSHRSGEQAAFRSPLGFQKCREVFESPFWERLLQLERGENCTSVCYHGLF